MAKSDGKARFSERLKAIEETYLHGTEINYENLWRFIQQAVALPRPETRPEGMSDEVWNWYQEQPWGGDPDPESTPSGGFFP
ncbi:MAG: hypothetical protein U5S82_14815 [Gammaproteobacteria bacterium]|nr:hypothetical protein [Gammaproteobacteria bacterium]